MSLKEKNENKSNLTTGRTMVHDTIWSSSSAVSTYLKKKIFIVNGNSRTLFTSSLTEKNRIFSQLSNMFSI
jgi:hypothetical protein